MSLRCVCVKGDTVVFDRCDFLLGENNSLVIILPVMLPSAENYTVSVSPTELKFKAGYDEIARMPFDNAEVYERLAFTPEVGLVEYVPGDFFPGVITAVAYVEIRAI